MENWGRGGFDENLPFCAVRALVARLAEETGFTAHTYTDGRLAKERETSVSEGKSENDNKSEGRERGVNTALVEDHKLGYPFRQLELPFFEIGPTISFQIRVVRV